MTVTAVSDEYARWPDDLKSAWMALSTVERGCLIRQRMIWRRWPQHRYNVGQTPPLDRPGKVYKLAQQELWKLEVAYRLSSHCRGIVEDR